MPKITDARREERRGQILKAAYACFARKGFEATRMQEICRQAKLSPGAVYLYFDGKDAIVRALAEQAEAASEAVWERIMGAGEASGTERIEKLFEAASTPGSAAAARMGVQFWAQAFDNQLLSDAMLADHEESVARIAGLLRSEADLAAADAKSLAELVIATLRGFGLQRAIVPTIDLKPAAGAFVRALRCELARASARRPPSTAGKGGGRATARPKKGGK